MRAFCFAAGIRGIMMNEDDYNELNHSENGNEEPQLTPREEADRAIREARAAEDEQEAAEEERMRQLREDAYRRAEEERRREQDQTEEAIRRENFYLY